jgi:hypothetical protein
MNVLQRGLLRAVGWVAWTAGALSAARRTGEGADRKRVGLLELARLARERHLERRERRAIDVADIQA